jgi:multiple sugar transport system substrate-binding protein
MRFRLLILVLVVVGSACAPAPSASPQTAAATTAPPAKLAADQKVSISFTNYNVATAGLGKEATEQLVAEFNQQFPNVDVQFRAVPSPDLISKTQAEVVAGNPPDIAQIVFSDLDFVVNDLRAKPLDTIVGTDEYQAYIGGEHPMHPRGLKLAELNGRMYGVPYVFSTPTLFYNANLFRQAGLDPEKPPTTWAEVKQYGLQIKQRTAKLGIDISCLGTFDWCFQALVLSNGGRVLSEDRARLTFAESPSVDAVAMWQDLVKSGIHPATTLSGADGFSGGNVAMLLNTSALQSSLLAASSGNWELRSAAMPAFEGKPVHPTNSGSALFILADDPLKQRAAWELMKFLTSERGYTIIQSKIGYLPLRPSIVNDERYLKDWVAANPLVQPNLKQLDKLEPWVAFPGPSYQNIRGTMMKAVEEVVLGGADARSTLADAQQRASQMMPRH